MIAHNVQQGTPEWLQLRLGIPTASRFDDILTPKARKYAASARKYINELVAEWIVGEPLDSFTSFAMEHGTMYEPEARSWYEFDTDTQVETVGFVTNDAGTVGCSPDGLVGADGITEIKCPQPIRHVENVLGGDIATIGQVQGCIWVCEREWVDTISYHPRIAPAVVRVWRDDEYLAALATAMDQFSDELAQAKEQVEALGDRGRREALQRSAA
jgi:hypothetical protein